MDADGCVRFTTGTPRIEVTSIFPWVLDEFVDRFGGRVRELKNSNPSPKDRTCWRWEISGDKAEMCLIHLTPHMIVKRVQAEIVLRARRLEPGPHRDSLVEQLRVLKHHNYEGNRR